MRRAHSIHEMREYLGRRSQDEDMISQVVARLREQKYLDDARYAADYARLHSQTRKQGRFRISRELRARGVPDHYIDAALDTALAETDEAQMVRAKLQRRLAHLRGPVDERKRASLYASLLRAGFSGETIRAELRNVTHGATELPSEAVE